MHEDVDENWGWMDLELMVLGGQVMGICGSHFFFGIYSKFELSKCFIFYFFVFLGLHPWHIEVPRAGVESEL